MDYWHSVCPVCDQGRLFIMKSQHSGKLFLLARSVNPLGKLQKRLI